MGTKTTLEQPCFNSGELSPFLATRHDIDRFAYGARTMTNFIPMLQGPARKRPGFGFVDDLGSNRLLRKAVFSQTDAYGLAFGDATLTFYTDHAPVLEANKTITGITQASPGVITSNSHGYTNGRRVKISAVVGMTELNGRYFTIAGVTTNTFTLVDMWGVAVNTTSYTAYSSAGTANQLYQIVSPYALADLRDSNGCCLMSIQQSADVLYICVPGYAPRKLTYTSANSWAFTTLDQTGGPFIGTDPDETITVYASAATGSVTLTASSAIFNANHVGALFLLEKKLTEITPSWESGKARTSGDVRRSQGNYYEALNSATTGGVIPTHTEGSRYDGDTGVNWQWLDSGYGWGKITAVGSSTSATMTVLQRLNSGSVLVGNASTQWSFGSWSADQGYPTHTALFRARQWFFRGTKGWASIPDDFENYRERLFGVVTDDSAIAIDIRIGQNDDIQWVMPCTDLLVGTGGNEFSIGEISTAGPLAPSNIASLRGPGYGSRRVEPALVNDGVIYTQPAGRVVRELRFDFSSNGYVALNKTAFAEHITKGAVNYFAFAKEPESIVWETCADGALLGMSFEREHQLLAWHGHVLGGAHSSGDPVCNCPVVIPSPEGDRDELYVSVKRTINGQTKYYLEYSSAHWDENTDDLEDMTYTDSFLSTAANTDTEIGGLEHLIGEDVRVLGDGRYLGEYTVSATGTVTLTSSSAPTVVHIGLPYTATLESMNLNRPNFLARWVNAFVYFVSSVYAKASGAWSDDRSTRKTWGPRDIGWTFSGYSVASPIPAQTRTFKVGQEGGHGREVYFTVSHDWPTACTVAGWIFDESKP